jgi:hypothetical protein
LAIIRLAFNLSKDYTTVWCALGRGRGRGGRSRFTIVGINDGDSDGDIEDEDDDDDNMPASDTPRMIYC